MQGCRPVLSFGPESPADGTAGAGRHYTQQTGNVLSRRTSRVFGL